MRKETYATSGTRMTVRFFGGYDYTPADAKSPGAGGDRLREGRADGRRSARRRRQARRPRSSSRRSRTRWAPTSTASRSSRRWVDASGKAQEKIYDVVWAGNRKPGKDGKLPPVGDTVDVAKATWTNTIGAPELVDGVEGPGLQGRANGPCTTRG